MVTPRHDIWLADLARAIAALQPGDDRAVEIMAGLLGIATESARDTSAPAPRKDAEIMPVPPPEARAPDTEAQAADREEESHAESAERLEVLQPVGRATAGSMRPWLLADDLEEFSEQHTGGVRAYEPLFVRSWSRELLAAALAQQIPGGPVDERRLVSLIASARPVTKIPRHPRRSLSRGVQVLVDLADGMEPFTRDQSELLEAIRRVVGNSRVQVLQFRDSPTREAAPAPSGPGSPTSRPSRDVRSWRSPISASAVPPFAPSGRRPNGPRWPLGCDDARPRWSPSSPTGRSAGRTAWPG